MGPPLKEALRRLCVEIGWSYAVFWKTNGWGNSRHLIWEEGHYEQTTTSPASTISELSATDILLSEWGVLRKTGDDHLRELTCLAENRVDVLVSKMMMPQVHAVGEGIVGRAAFSGNHQWILQSAHLSEAYLSEGFTEINQQFWAGMRTLAVIPVLPYGVLQLGSTQEITENLGFIQHVRSLFVQLGYLPGVLLSDSIKKTLEQKNQVCPSHGSPFSPDQPGNTCTKVASENCKQEFEIFRAQRPVMHPSCFFGIQFDEKKSPNSQGMLLNTNPVLTAASNSLDPYSHFEAHPSIPSILHVNRSLEGGSVRGQAALFNTDVQSIQKMLSHEPRSGGQHQYSVATSALASSSLSYLEQHHLSSVGQQDLLRKMPTLNSTKAPQPRPYGQTGSSSLTESLSVSLLSKTEQSDNANDLGMLGPVSCRVAGDSNRTQNTNLPGISEPQISSSVSHSNNNLMLSEEVTPSPLSATGSHSWILSTVEMQKVRNELYQALDNPCGSSDESSRCAGSLLGYIQDCLLNNTKSTPGSPRNQKTASEENDNSLVQNGKIVKDDDFKSLHMANERTSDASIPHLSGDDLFDALGLDFKSRYSDGGLDAVVNRNHVNAWESCTEVSTCITELDGSPIFSATHDSVSCGSGIFSETGPDQLLDAVVSKINLCSRQRSTDDLSSKTTLTKICSSSIHDSSPKYGWVSSQPIPGELFSLPPVVKTEAAGSLSVKSSCSLERAGECSQRDITYKSQISLWVENGQSLKSDSALAAQCKRIEEGGKPTRKRPRPGENPRPRPKDRQMIQDRVKELREIVPNSGKCSIDALLERTINHMLFLQSVTKHADKLKEAGEPKIFSKEGGLLLKDNFEGGATWAFEVGTQSMVCPIIVGDLNPPRQLLVEMLCQERGFFLEIADLIKGLGLTILKGVMEARNGKIWARFAVEANRDVTRMEIFMSLVRLLEPTVGSSSVQSPDMGNINMAHKMLHQSSVLPIGLVNHLQ